MTPTGIGTHENFESHHPYSTGFQARVPTGEYGYHYHNPWYPWYLLVQVWSHLLAASVVATLSPGYALMR